MERVCDQMSARGYGGLLWVKSLRIHSHRVRVFKTQLLNAPMESRVGGVKSEAVTEMGLGGAHHLNPISPLIRDYKFWSYSPLPETLAPRRNLFSLHHMLLPRLL
jgi:hypothetical protein